MSIASLPIKPPAFSWAKVMKYFAVAKMNFTHSHVYLFDAFSMGGMVAVRVWILFLLYKAAYSSLGQAEVGGLTLAHAVWIILFTQVFQMSNAPRKIVFKMSDDIKSGDIAYMLIRPMSYLLHILIGQWGVIFSRLFFSLIIGVLAPLFLVGSFPVSVPSVLASALLLIFGMTLGILMSMCVGLFAFWTEDVSAFRWIFDKLQWYLGGLVIPVALFPETLRSVVELAPFAHMYYGPARILVKYDPDLFIQYLTTQIVWLVVIALVTILIYKKGIKNVSINGG
jgi:ABC-2 type transport system permease protein